MYVIGHCPNTNFEWDLFKHVWVMALDRENSQTKWLLGGHIGSYHKTNWRAYVCHSMLPLYQVWKKSVQASPRNGCGRTDGRTDGRTHARTDRRNPIHKSPFRTSSAGTNYCSQSLTTNQAASYLSVAYTINVHIEYQQTLNINRKSSNWTRRRSL